MQKFCETLLKLLYTLVCEPQQNHGKCMNLTYIVQQSLDKKISVKNSFESTHPFSPVYPPLPMTNVWSLFCRIERFTSLLFSVSRKINKLFVNFDLKNSTF